MKQLSKPTLMYLRFVTVALVGMALIGFVGLVQWQPPAVAKPRPAGAVPAVYTVYDHTGAPLAVFTKGARTVVMKGPSRTFAEPSSTTATITTNDWVRLYPTVFDGTVDREWLAKMANENNNRSSADILQTAMQYIANAPTVKVNGKVISSDAGYGPLTDDSDRRGGSDFNDYLGIPYTYNGVVDRPEPQQFGDLDCSGFQRMVWGYRNGMPLELQPTGKAIPRRAFQILSSAPGIVVVPDTNKQIVDFSRLQTGDLVFQSVEPADNGIIDHIGLYLGIDSQGHRRFISSRKAANGPTFGDIGGRSVLDGNGLYASNFRAVRRL